MKLEFLKYDKCPICNSEIVMISKNKNYERIKFECGCEKLYLINNEKEREVIGCTKDEKLKEFYNLRLKAIDDIKFFIFNLDVDYEFKNSILDNDYINSINFQASCILK